MNVKYTPEKLDPNEGKADFKGKLLKDQFTGEITIRMPTYPERLRFPKEIGIEAAIDVADAEESLSNSLKQLEILAVCAEKVKTFITGVDIKITSDGTELKTVDDLYMHPDAGVLISSLCSKFLLGFLEKKV